MSLAGKIRKAADLITGHAAKVELTLEKGCIGKPFNATVTINSGINDIHVNNVYLNIQCVKCTKEEVKIDAGADFEETLQIIYINKVLVADARIFKANQTYTLTKEIILPLNSEETTNSENLQVIWEFQAGLDAIGNDPDSGWVQSKIAK